jgi:hypothetical protein
MRETFARWAGSMLLGPVTAHAIKDEAARQKRCQEIVRDAKDMALRIKPSCVKEAPSGCSASSRSASGFFRSQSTRLSCSWQLL